MNGVIYINSKAVRLESKTEYVLLSLLQEKQITASIPFVGDNGSCEFWLFNKGKLFRKIKMRREYNVEEAKNLTMNAKSVILVEDIMLRGKN